MVAGGLPPADALSAWIILRSHIHSPCWQELPTAMEIPLALRPPAALARRTRARNGPEAFAISAGAFQAPVGWPAPTCTIRQSACHLIPPFQGRESGNIRVPGRCPGRPKASPWAITCGPFRAGRRYRWILRCAIQITRVCRSPHPPDQRPCSARALIRHLLPLGEGMELRAQVDSASEAEPTDQRSCRA